MKENTKRLISIIFTILALIPTVYLFVLGLASINAPGLKGIGIIFIVPALIGIVTIILDYLININLIKKGLLYSCIVTIIRLGIIGILLPVIIVDLDTMPSDIVLNIYIVLTLLIMAIPSIINIIKLKDK